MRPEDRRIVTGPLTELWNTSGPVHAEKKRMLAEHDIKELLRIAPLHFVVADAGLQLQWIDKEECYRFWKEEVKGHIHTEERPRLEDYPGDYFYFASEWRLVTGEKVVLLEKAH